MKPRLFLIYLVRPSTPSLIIPGNFRRKSVSIEALFFLLTMSADDPSCHPVTSTANERPAGACARSCPGCPGDICRTFGRYGPVVSANLDLSNSDPFSFLSLWCRTAKQSPVTTPCHYKKGSSSYDDRDLYRLQMQGACQQAKENQKLGFIL